MALYAKPLAFIYYANILRLLGAMRVLEGHRTFAEGLGQIMFKGSKKNIHIEKKSFLLCLLFRILLFGGAKIPKTNRAYGPTT